MSLGSKVDDCQQNLDKLSRRLKIHTKTAQQTVDSDQNDVLQRLRDGVNSVKAIAKAARSIQETRSIPQDVKSVVRKCQVCKKDLKEMYFECYDCEASAAHFLVGKTTTCLSCAETPSCKIGHHYPAIRSISFGHWRLKAPLPFTKVFDTDWLRCDICRTVISDPEVEFSWCLNCIGKSQATFCNACTSKGKRCLVKEHGSPVSRLEIINGTQICRNMGVPSVEPLGTNLTSKQEALLQMRSTQIIYCFTRLAGSAKKQLDDIMSINTAAIELEDRLGRLRLDLNEAATEASCAIKGAQASLTAKETELIKAQKDVVELEEEMSSITRKMEGNRDDRNFLRVVRAATWVSAIIIPPLAIGGVLMEVGNLELKDRKNNMNQQKKNIATNVSVCEAGIQTIRDEQGSLKSALKEKESMSNRCKVLTTKVKITKKSLINKQRDYQILKEAASSFLQWTERLHSQSDMLIGFTDGDELRDMMNNLISELLKCRDKSIADTCKPLQEMLLQAPFQAS